VKSKHGFETTLERSKLMSRIRGTNTKPEIALRKALWALGFRYRLNVKKLPGKPDIVIRKYKLAIFVDGEFWHGYQWKTKKPKIKSNTDYWIKKIEGNIARDKLNNRKLKDEGFTVLRFWEHAIRKDIEKCVSRIIEARDTFNP
jgi:DNA mismatch endonuclease (patch repair protein)